MRHERAGLLPSRSSYSSRLTAGCRLTGRFLSAVVGETFVARYSGANRSGFRKVPDLVDPGVLRPLMAPNSYSPMAVTTGTLSQRVHHI
jgi:hypothetical protein